MHESRRERWQWRSVAAALLVLGAAVALVVRQKGPPIDWNGVSSGVTRIRVATFHATGVSGWQGGAIEDSIASRLSRSELQVARVGGEDAESDYVVEGDVAPEDGRVVINLRLRPSGQRTLVWQATYWRSVVNDSLLIRDLAAAVDSALRSRRR